MRTVAGRNEIYDGKNVYIMHSLYSPTEYYFFFTRYSLPFEHDRRGRRKEERKKAERKSLQ